MVSQSATAPDKEPAISGSPNSNNYLFVCCHCCLKTIMIRSPADSPPSFASKEGAYFILTTCRACLNVSAGDSSTDSTKSISSKHRFAFNTVCLSKDMVKSTEAYRAVSKIAGGEVIVMGIEDSWDHREQPGVRYESVLEVVKRMVDTDVMAGVNVKGLKTGGNLLMDGLPGNFLYACRVSRSGLGQTIYETTAMFSL